MDKAQALDAVHPTFQGLCEAWKSGDGNAFAAQFTDDADFINLLGMYVQGRAPIAQLHDKIFKGPYANSTVRFDPQQARMLSAEMILVIAASQVDIPAGPVKGIVRTVATVLLQRVSSAWKIALFHNTRVEATQARHSEIMSEAVQQ